MSTQSFTADTTIVIFRASAKHRVHRFHNRFRRNYIGNHPADDTDDAEDQGDGRALGLAALDGKHQPDDAAGIGNQRDKCRSDDRDNTEYQRCHVQRLLAVKWSGRTALRRSPDTPPRNR